MYTSIEPAKISPQILAHLDPTEKVMIARRFHWAALLKPIAVVVAGVFVSIAVDLVSETKPTTGNSHEVHGLVWVLWAAWLVWTVDAAFGLGKARVMLNKKRSNQFAALIVLAGIAYVLVRVGEDPRFRVGGVVLFVLLVVVCWALTQVAEWADRFFVLTNKRIVVIEGIITTTVRSMPASRLTDMAYRRTGFGRALGYGLLDVESAGQDQALKIMNFVPNPENTNLQISNILFGSSPAKAKGIQIEGQVDPGSGRVSLSGQMDG